MVPEKNSIVLETQINMLKGQATLLALAEKRFVVHKSFCTRIQYTNKYVHAQHLHSTARAPSLYTRRRRWYGTEKENCQTVISVQQKIYIFLNKKRLGVRVFVCLSRLYRKKFTFGFLEVWEGGGGQEQQQRNVSVIC